MMSTVPPPQSQTTKLSPAWESVSDVRTLSAVPYTHLNIATSINSLKCSQGSSLGLGDKGQHRVANTRARVEDSGVHDSLTHALSSIVRP